jgi:O-antigen ligase
VRMRIAYWAFIPVTGVSVLLTGSRSGAISLAVAVLVLLFFVAKVGWRARIAALLAVAALAVILPQVVPEALVRRVTEGTESAGFRARVELWQQGLDAVQKVPFTGIGAAASSDDNAFGIVLHNSFISVLVETGVIGFVLFMGILAAVIRAAWLMPARERAFWLGVLAVWGPFALAGTNEYVKNTWFVFAMILAQSAALRGTQPHGAGLLNGVSSTAKYVLLTPRHTA